MLQLLSLTKWFLYQNWIIHDNFPMQNVRMQKNPKSECTKGNLE
jgi:hypothetical protein